MSRAAAWPPTCLVVTGRLADVRFRIGAGFSSLWLLGKGDFAWGVSSWSLASRSGHPICKRTGVHLQTSRWLRLGVVNLTGLRCGPRAALVSSF